MQAGAHFDGSRRIASCFGSSKPSRSTGSAAPTSPKRVFSACVTASLKRSAVTLALPSSNALPRKRRRVTRCEGEESEELRAHVAAEEHVGRVRHASESSAKVRVPGAARETCGAARAVRGVEQVSRRLGGPAFDERKRCPIATPSASLPFFRGHTGSEESAPSARFLRQQSAPIALRGTTRRAASTEHFTHHTERKNAEGSPGRLAGH